MKHRETARQKPTQNQFFKGTIVHCITSVPMRAIGYSMIWLLFASATSLVVAQAPTFEQPIATQAAAGNAIVSSVQQVGTPTVGAAGITVTIDELNRLQRQRDVLGASARRLMKPILRPARRNLPQAGTDESPKLATATYKLSDAGSQAKSQAVSTGFTGATLADANAFPPDTMGTVGPTQFVVAVNGRIRSFNKTTGVADGVLNLPMDTFFASVMTPTGGTVTSNFTSDPHIRYDRLSQRWIVVMIDVPNVGTLANRMMFAVSSGRDIASSSSFTFFQFKHDTLAPAGDTGNFADYPTLGIDTSALYIGANIFTPAGAFAGTSAYVVRKSSILGPGPIVATAFRNLTGTPSGAGIYTPQGVDNNDPAATEGYLIGTDNASFGKLVVRRVSTPGATPTISANIFVTVNATQSPLTVPHLGNTGGANGNLDGSDDRLYAAHMRSGRLWTAHAIGVNSGGTTTTPTRNASRWYELQNLTGTPTVVQQGTVFDPATSTPKFFWMPTIMVSGQGHTAIGFSTAGTNNSANAGTTGRWASDTLGTMQTPASYEYTASSTAYNPPGDSGGAFGRRWGDYSFTSLDPEDDMTMWTIQEFCDATNSFGVRAAKLLAPPPPPTFAAAPNLIATNVASTNVVITGSGVTATNGAGFFDPGAGFAKRLAAVVPGVIVNSVTYTDPTHVTINVSTVGSASGSKNVTVTNPDGQAVTANGLLTVTTTPPTISSANAATFTVGTSGSFTVTTTGNPVPSLVRSGAALPSAVTFVDNNNGTGTLSGTPATATGGTYAITFTASNGTLPNAAQNFTLTVNEAPAFTSAAPPASGVIGTAYSHTYSATGFPATFTYSVTSGSLPAGLTLSGSSISGTPTTAGAFSGVVTLSNGIAPTATQAFTISIPKTPQTLSNFAASPANPVFAPNGTFMVSAIGGASGNPVIFSVAPASASVCTAGGSNGATITMLAGGTCMVLADQAGNTNYAAATQATLSVAIAKAAQTITFPAITPFSWYQGSATLAATASSGLAVTYAVSSGPCTLAGSVLTASSPGTCVITANQGGNGNFTAAAQQSQSATVNVAPPLLDIDASGAPTKYDPATDGLMVMRFLLGYQGNTITDLAISSPSGRTPAQMVTHLASIQSLLDVDGDGSTRATSDGLLIVRYMLGLRGAALLAGAAVGPVAAAQVEAAIGRLMPP